MSTGEPVVRVRSVRRFWGAHAPRVLIAAPRRNALVKEKFAMARAPSRAREGACAPQRILQRRPTMRIRVRTVAGFISWRPACLCSSGALWFCGQVV